jgi:hypothetical protein
MSTGRFFAIALTVFALAASGCGETKAQKAEREVNDGNARIAATDTLTNQLNDNYRVNIDPLFGSASSMASSKDWSQYSDSALTDIEAKLRDVIGNVNQIKEYATHDGITLLSTGGLDRRKINAQSYLDSLLAYKSRPKPSGAKMATGSSNGLLVAEGNAAIGRINSEKVKLLKYGINLNPILDDNAAKSAAAKKWDSFNYSERSEIKTSLQNVIKDSGRVIEITQNQEVWISSKSEVQKVHDNALVWMSYLTLADRSL